MDYLGTGIAVNAPATWSKVPPEILAIMKKRMSGEVANPEHQAALDECRKIMPSLRDGTDYGTDKNISRSNQVGELRMKIKEMAMEDERLKPELKIWSECMSTKNFSIEFPSMSKIAGGGNELNENHLAIYGEFNELLAVADVECKQQTGFIDAWHKVLDEVEEREVKNNLTISSIMYSAPECYPDVS
ncbi:MAG: hypothetical protein LBI63_00040 [Candidatus Ancillula sp.]|jgi:hypothetical protein|nr:hypothetical protein [Candidatus Ancillula sp.]